MLPKLLEGSGPADAVESVAEIDLKDDLAAVAVAGAPLPQGVDDGLGAQLRAAPGL